MTGSGLPERARARQSSQQLDPAQSRQLGKEQEVWKHGSLHPRAQRWGPRT